MDKISLSSQNRFTVLEKNSRGHSRVIGHLDGDDTPGSFLTGTMEDALGFQRFVRLKVLGFKDNVLQVTKKGVEQTS